MNITKCENGYILKDGDIIYIATDIQELFTRMLHLFEGKTEFAGGDYYGKVIVKLDNDDYDG